ACNRGDFTLHPRARLAFLGKAGRQNYGRLDASPPAAFKLRRCKLCWDDEDREVGRFGQDLNRWVGFQTLNLSCTTTDRVNVARERMAQNDFENPPAQSLNVRGGADNGDRFRPEHFPDVGHGVTSGPTRAR